MCGIGGMVYKSAGSRRDRPVGDELVKMLDSLAHRGRDSTGVAVAGEEFEDDLIVRLWTGETEGSDVVFERAQCVVREVGWVVGLREVTGQFFRLGVTGEHDWDLGDVHNLADALVEVEGVVLHSIGRASEVIKDVGTAREVDNRHCISRLRGTHGIGHVRMATESRVDITHSHPFWAYPFPDIAVVHNGQLTNYYKLKRHYEEVGCRFQTHNDSELIAVYLADKLSKGIDLEDALRSSLDDLDGTFTYLVSTKDAIGYAKDRWGAKPLVTMETEEVVAVASEEVALRRVFPGELERAEPQQSEVMTWSV